MKKLITLLGSTVILILILVSTVYGDPTYENQVKDLETRIKSLEVKLNKLNSEIEVHQKEINELSKEKTRLKKIYKKSPSGINEAKLNKVLSKLRAQIEEVNKLEIDKEIKKEELQKLSEELIRLHNQKIQTILKEIEELEKKGETEGIPERIELILELQSKKDKLYLYTDQSYPEISKVPFEVSEDEPAEILNEKLNFVNDQLLLLDIRARRLNDVRERLLIEYKVLQVLIDFYHDPSPEKEEMFDQMEILAFQIEEQNNLLKENNKLKDQYEKLKIKIESLLEKTGGSP